jgi:hypothetical protein
MTEFTDHPNHAHELRKIVIIHRHGARFPLKSLYSDLSWPINKQFWEAYKGQLTPIGIKQLFDVGTDIREFYGEFIESIDSRCIKVHSSNSQRTMMSGWSFLQGAFPGRSFYFKYMGDQRQTKMNAYVENQIPIIIEAQSKTDKLFHTGKSQRKKNHVSENITSSDLIKEISTDKAYIDLCDKLFRMTKIKGLDPSNDIVERLTKFRTVHTQLAISRAHNLHNIANVGKETLTDAELDMIEIVGSEIKKCSYMPGNERVQKKPVCSNYLLNEIYRYICCSDVEFLHLSAHDTTLMELGIALGLKIPTPDFASYFLIEVKEDIETSTEYLSIYFNPDPSKFKRADLKAKTWNLSDKYLDWNNLEEGSIPLTDFEERYQLNNLQRIYQLVSKLQQQSFDVFSPRSEAAASPISSPLTPRSAFASAPSILSSSKTRIAIPTLSTLSSLTGTGVNSPIIPRLPSTPRIITEYAELRSPRLRSSGASLTDSGEMSPRLTREQIEEAYPEIAELFCYVDEDNDEHIGLDEYLTLFERLGYTDSFDDFVAKLNRMGIPEGRRMSLPDFYNSVKKMGYERK